MADHATLRELERRLRDLDPDGGGGTSRASDDLPPGVSTGIAALDALLPRGGLPRGAATEWRGPRSCGKTSLLRATLARRRDAGEPVALIDATRTLHAPDWTGLEEGSGSFWMLRPSPGTEASRCADLLLRSSAFGTVALMLGEAPLAAGARLRRSGAVRLRRLAEEAGAVFLVVGELPLAALRIRFRAARVDPVTDVPFGPFLPALRPVWVRVGERGSAEVPVLCPRPPRRRRAPPPRDRKGPARQGRLPPPTTSGS